MSRAWYDDGKLLHKHNSFTDLIACAEHVVAECYTSAARLAIMGGSAGGLLVGATVTLRPDLFKAVIAHIPFVASGRYNELNEVAQEYAFLIDVLGAAA